MDRKYFYSVTFQEGEQKVCVTKATRDQANRIWKKKDGSILRRHNYYGSTVSYERVRGQKAIINEEPI